MAAEMVFSDLTAHRVYQRNDRNEATIAFEVALSGGMEGRLEARASNRQWEPMGIAAAGKVNVSLTAVPVGEHRIDVRVVDDSGNVPVQKSVSPLFVGDLWLLAGQSNMEGVGPLIDVETPLPGVNCFYMGDRWDMAEEPLCWLLESLDPVHRELRGVVQEEVAESIRQQRVNREKGAGLGLPFGKMMLRHTGIPIGLIMAAHGGTSMSQWDASRAGDDGHSLYGAMMRVVRKLGGKIRGCLWYQGESDAEVAASELYYGRMIEWVSHLRRDVEDPALPFIYAQLSVVTHWSEEAPWNRIQQEQLRLEQKLGHAELVPTIDARLTDTIHPDTESLRTIGYRMAWAALRLAHGIRAADPGPRLAAARWNDERTELTLELTGLNGVLRPVVRVFGIHLMHEDTNLPLASRLSDDRKTIVVCLKRPAPRDVRLWHGRGLNPTVNIRDELGIPLVVFGPISV